MKEEKREDGRMKETGQVKKNLQPFLLLPSYSLFPTPYSLNSYSTSLILVLRSKISFNTKVTTASIANNTAAEKAASVSYCL